MWMMWMYQRKMPERQTKAGNLKNLKNMKNSHSFSLSHSVNLSFTHSRHAEQVLFSSRCLKVAVIGENCNAFFLPQQQHPIH